MAIYYIDPVNGNDANSGADWANAWKTTYLGATAARTAPGDTIKIAKSGTPTLACSANWTQYGTTITLPSGKWYNFDSHFTATTGWVPQSGVSLSVQNKGINARNGLRFTSTVAGAQKLAHKDLGSTDLSAFQQFSLFVRGGGNTLYDIKFCSDANGDTPVETFTLGNCGSSGSWVWNKGSALSATVRSIALYSKAALSSGVVDLYNPVVTKGPSASDCITHLTLISESSLERNQPYGQYCVGNFIGDTQIEFGSGYDQYRCPQVNQYLGLTNASGDLYVRQPLIRPDTTNVSPMYCNEAGTAGAAITFSGGWDTGSDTQNGETWFHGRYVNADGVYAQSNVSIIRVSVAGVIENQDLVHVENRSGFSIDSDGMVCGGRGVTLNDYGSSNTIRLNYIVGANCGINDNRWHLYVYGQNDFYAKIGFMGGNADGFGLVVNDYQKLGFNLVIEVGKIQKVNRALHLARVIATIRGLASIQDCTTPLYAMGDPLDITFENCLEIEPVWNGYEAGGKGTGVFRQTNYGQTAGQHRTDYEWGQIRSESTVRHTPSGISWQMRPNPAGSTGLADIPRCALRMVGARLGLNSGQTAEAAFWLRRSHASINGRVFIRGGQLGGPVADTYASITTGIDTWQKVTVNWTSTKKGVVEIEVQAYGPVADQYLYVDDLEAMVI